MSELKRSVICRKSFLLLGIFVLMNIIFCVMQCNETQNITLSGEELEQYISYYPEYIQNTLENAESVNILGNLGKHKDFNSRNVEKTVEDFDAMVGIKLEAGENRGVVLFGDFELTDFLIVGFGLYLVLIFTGEYRKGLSLLIFSTPKGRRILGLRRIAILFGTLAAVAAILYGSTIVTLNIMYPGINSTRSIQSVPAFMKSTFAISVGGYLIRTIVVKYLAVCTISMLIFGLISVIRSTLAIILGGSILLLEFLMYSLIIPTSSLNYLRYLNLYGLLRARDGFVYYYNLNIAGKPVTLLWAQIICGAAVLLLFTVVVLLGQGMRPYDGAAGLRKVAEAITRFFQKRRPAVPAFLWEGHKILLSQYGILIMLGIFYLAVSSSTKTEYRDFRNKAYVMYYEEYAGTITEEKIKSAEKTEAKHTKYYNNALKNIEKAKADPNFESNPNKNSELLGNEITVRKYEYTLPALRAVLSNMKTANEYYEKTGRQLSLVEPFSYEMLIKHDRKTYFKNVLYSLICMILVFSGVMNYEKNTNTEMILHTMPFGRGSIVRNKIIWVVILSVLITLPIHLIQFFRIGQVFPYKSIWEPVQSLEMFRELPIELPIAVFLVILYIFRCLIAVACGVAVMFAGRRCKNRISCIVICLSALLISALLAITAGAV